MNKCGICPNHCPLDYQTICGRKSNIDENTVDTTAVNIDPIEKKPLYHFMPASKTLSIGTLGCNLKCLNCQNHTIAQPENPELVRTRKYTPESIVQIALNNRLRSISWTYNEPSIYPEWIINTAKIAKKHDIKTILVTNGYTSNETLNNLAEYVDAVNVDLKSMEERFYKKICSGQLRQVLNSIKFYNENSIHLEVTTLLIPGYNLDSIGDVIGTIRKIDENIPLHFSAFYPQFKLLNVPPTDDEVIFDACELAIKKGIANVYAGNTYPSKYDNTYCKHCHEILIEREHYNVKNNVKEGKCPYCGEVVDICV
ncbi:MAG: AmmeMemoRadiSam system radical SAM enzyme [Methanosphaera sp. rholeuAM270]|nr:MAG: AmmeMemoRadiSam system radical SAM enzyme [Methanosphaera sp. rholeuAM270]